MAITLCSVTVTVVLLLWAAWGVFAVRFTNKIFKKLEYLFKADPNEMSKVLCGSRYDQSYLSRMEIYVGAVVLLPIRVVLFLFLFAVGQLFTFVFAKIYKIDLEHYYQPRSKLSFTIYHWVIGFLSRCAFFVFGMYYMPIREVNIKDIWCDYKPLQDVSRAPIVISNHVSYLDMWILLHIRELPGFLAKQSITKFPVVSTYSMIQQCIYINRDEKEQRDNILKKIVERCKLVEEGKMGPLLIFPEGTTTNGRALMKFKKGAFFAERPFHVYSVMYSKDPAFVPCYNLIHPGYSFFIFVSKFVNQVEYYRLDQPIDPLWILQKNGRAPGQEDNWELIADETKKLMCFAFGFESDNSSFQEKKEFDKKVQNLSEEEFRKRGE